MTRSIVATLATSVLIATAHAQCPLSFAPAVSYATAGNGLGLAVADLNNDGLQDVVVGYSSAGGQVSVFLNQGGGVLGARTDFPTGTNFGMNSIESADLNADGFRDLVCGIFGGGVRILFNNGSGGFGAAVVYGGTASVRQVAIGDIDGNGTPDVVAADSSGASKVLSFLNSAGTGVLTSPPALNLPGSPNINGIALVNDDNDSSLDVLFSAGPSGMYRAKGNGNGTFQTPSLALGSVGGAFIRLADVTGDGRPDVFIPHQAQQGVFVCTNTGPGTYSNAGLVSVPGTNIKWSCAVADVNGDGVKDLLDPRSSPARLGVALGLGGTSFAAPVDLVTAGSQGVEVEAADLNNDGRIDAVMTDLSSSQLFVFMNTTTPLVTGPTSQAIFAGGSATFTVTAPTATNYQWRRNGVPLTEGGHFTGVNTATLTIIQATSIEFGNYDCVVTGCSGGTTTTASAFLAVNQPCPADLDNGTSSGTPDGGVDINDLLYFLERFEQGC
jgi:hypothetical protein